MKRSLCLVYNFAPHYRKGIFTLIDKAYDCTWYFGRNNTDIRGLDLSLLRDVHTVVNRRVAGSYYWQPGCFSLLFAKRFDTYFILGDTHSLSSWAMLAAKRLLCPGKRIYVWTHGWYGKEGRLKQIMKKVYYKMADGIFLYGHYAKGLMTAQGFSPDRLFVVHNSLDYDRQLALRRSFRPSDIYRRHFSVEGPTLVFIGRLTRVKRIDLLLEAVAMLKQSGKPCNLTLIGDGEMREQLVRRAAELGIDGQVWFYGACYDEAENAELIYNADLCVAPGNVGLTAIHTLTFGTPVATHDSLEWQMPEFESIHEGLTGTFFHKDDAAAIARAVEAWLATHPDREAVREACFAEIDQQWTPAFQMDVIRKHLTFPAL